ncbi:MarR family transcriptional regulator [Thioalkalivibrio denitrificans]|uniref:MarR family transcriptional regulator n=1 Tax=Thioalkalivibrio denitrificans TaxID=108003 RepID=A0A1V3NLR5_9GAMM|nr:MarR family winged helix-turn-helix transcriptional regulator [Thioalkalivibrio denitrificans]OOG25676.1 MarR family transcriptional regulator [Thioalkalivibrio denitrificans]
MSTPRSSLSGESGSANAAQSIIRQLRVVFRALQNHSRSIEKACGVSAAQLWALWELHNAPGLRVGDLSHRLLIHPSTASNMLDKLESKHLVERRRTGMDQRVVSLFLTPRGEDLLRAAPAPAEGELNRALQALPGQQLAALESGLAALLEHMQAHDEQAALRPIAGDD